MADHAADHPSDLAPGSTPGEPPALEANQRSKVTRSTRRTRRPPRRRHVLRSAIVVLAMVPVLAISLYWIATRSWFIIAVVTPALEARIGGEVGIASARYDGDGTFVFDDLRVRVPGMQGLGAELFRIGEVAVDVDMDKLMHGEVQILNARVDDMHIRTSENKNIPGEYNFMLLKHDWERDSHESTRLPHIEITSAIIETGVHNGAEYELVGQRRLAGQMHRIAQGDSVFSFELGEIDEHGNGLGENGLVINGRWDSETFEYGGRIDGLRLDEQARRMCPQMARIYWDRMQLEGTVGTASIQYRVGEPLSAELSMENVAMTMPVHVEGLWSRYRAPEVLDTEARPRMQVRKGTIRLIGDRLELDKLEGYLLGSEPSQSTVGVPYRLTLTVPELPALDWNERTQWLDQMLATLPFQMELTMDDFRFDPKAETKDAWLELPTVVARMFSLFEMTGWQLSTKITVERESATIQDDGSPKAGALHSNGRAFIRHAAGRYRRFPYQLTDVEAYIEFDNDKCDVHYLNGRGAGDAVVRLAGMIAPPKHDGAVDLRVDATNVPLDDRLRQALTGQGAEVFDSLFHEPSLEKLAGAGMITTEEDISTMRERVASLTIERGALLQRKSAPADGERPEFTGDDVAAGEKALAQITSEIDRLNAIIEAGPFALGGVVDLDLQVTRERGEGHRATITGQVDIKSAGILYEKFPYPIRVTDGMLEWGEDGVTIKSSGERRGLGLITAGGGRGVLAGGVALERDDEDGVHGKPSLSLTMMGDAINPALLAAIPSGDDESPVAAGESSAVSRDRAMRLLRGLGLSGTLECTGEIGTLPGGAMSYDFIVGLNHGASVPTPDVSDVMAELGLRWPEGFSLEEVEGVVHITPGEIGLVSLVGRRGDGTVTADGNLDIAGAGHTELNVTFESLALEQYLVNLAPANGVEKAQELWDQYRPQGVFDATLRYLAGEGEPGVAELVVQPQVLRIASSGQPVSMYRQDGAIVLHENEVRFDQLQLDIKTGSRDDGLLLLDGSYGSSVHGQMLSVSGAWSEGMFECPLILEMMRLIGAKNELQRYEKLMPAGSFDATFSYRSPQGDAPESYTFDMRPSSIALVLDGMVLSATLEPSSSVVFTPGLIELTDVVGQHSGGTFRAAGDIALGATPAINLDLSYHGDLVSQHIWAMLPEEVRSALKDIQFHSAQAGSVHDATLQLTRGEDSSEWSLDFSGLIETGSCSFDVGMPFTDVEGRFQIDATRQAGGPAKVSILATADRLRVLDREMSNLTAKLMFDQHAQELTIRELRGELYGGIVTAEATVGLGAERDDYAMRVIAAGVALDKIASAESLAASESEVERLTRHHAVKSIDAGAAAGGQLFASLDLAGERGKGFSRSGRGTMRVVGGEVANLSLTLRVLQLMQFVPPFADTMDYADVEYYVAGDRVVFERILLEIPFLDRAALQLHGEGEMDFNTFELNTRFRSRGTIPMLSDLVGGLSDRLYQIEVTGPITDPVARVLALPDFTATRKVGSNSVVRPTDPELIVQEPVN